VYRLQLGEIEAGDSGQIVIEDGGANEGVMKMIETIFTNSSWKFSTAIAYPNQLAARNDVAGTIIGAVVALRRTDGRGQDFALSTAGLEYLLKAEEEGRIAEGYVVLGYLSNDGRREFVAAERAHVVHERLRGYAPLDGDLGLYFWITREFMPAVSMRLDRNAPF
jgi:hypothetical protein